MFNHKEVRSGRVYLDQILNPVFEHRNMFQSQRLCFVIFSAEFALANHFSFRDSADT